MTVRPNLPKRLAAKIRAAQSRVRSARECIEHYQERIQQHGERQAEYDADPSSFAETYYKGCGGVESYPVQTTISRNRESLTYYTSHFEEKVCALAAADKELALLEISVLDEINSMRPGTPGRVAWPEPIVSIEIFRSEAFSRRKAEREEQVLRDAKTAAENAAFERANPEFTNMPGYSENDHEVSHFQPEITINSAQAHFAIAPGRVIALTFKNAADSTACGTAIQNRRGFFNFNKWEVFARLCWYGIRWTGFETWLRNYQSNVARARSEATPYTDSANPDPAPPIQYLSTQQICQTLPGFFPPEVFPEKLAGTSHTWPFQINAILCPVLSESSLLYYTRFAYFRLTTLTSLRNHIAQLERRHLLVDDNCSYNPPSPDSIIRELSSAQLVVFGQSVPSDLVLSGLNTKQLIALLKSCSQKSFRTRADNRAAVNEAMETRPTPTLEALHATHYSPGLAAFLPPKKVSWQAFQDSRQIGIAMATTLQELTFSPDRFSAAELELLCRSR